MDTTTQKARQSARNIEQRGVDQAITALVATAFVKASEESWVKIMSKSLYLGLESARELADGLGHQRRVVQTLPGLHDPDDRGLDQHLPVLVDGFVHLVRLGLGLQTP